MGRLISFAGIDGAGKTTQARMLCACLAERGISVRFLPNGSLLAFRRRLDESAQARGALNGRDLLGPDTYRFALAVPKWLQFAEVSEHTRQTDGVVVVDRYCHCQIAQAQAAGASQQTTGLMADLFASFEKPAVTIMLDVPPEIAIRRIDARGADTESYSDLAALRAAYNSLYGESGWKIIDGTPKPSDVHGQILHALAPILAAGVSIGGKDGHAPNGGSSVRLGEAGG